MRDSFSAVSKPNVASEYSLESSWRDLQDLHAFAPLSIQNFSQVSSNFFRNFTVLFWKVHWFFQKSCLKFTEFHVSLEFQHFLRKTGKRPEYVRFSNFLRFQNRSCRIFQKINCVLFSICACHPENYFPKVRKKLLKEVRIRTKSVLTLS